MKDQIIAGLRVPPHSVEAEQSVLGGLLLCNDAWDRIGDAIAEGDFYRSEHRLIFRAIKRLIENAKPADVVTVAEFLDAHGKSEASGGLSYLGELAANTPSAANIRRYAEIVRERSIMRGLVNVADQIADAALNPLGRDAATLLDESVTRLMKLVEVSEYSDPGPVHINPVLTQVIERLQELHDRDERGAITGTATGFADLDRKLCGLQPGDLIVIAGRPSMGKTAFGINIAENVAVDGGLPVVIFSMEMERAQLATRMLSSIGRVDSQRLRTADLDDDDWSRTSVALGKLHQAPIFIDETGALTPDKLRHRARKVVRENGNRLGLIVVDYIQLMTTGRRNENRTTEVGEISRALKALAKELRVPVVALSQLSRNVETRPDKRPMMSDLRESGAIEQDADVILMMYRDDYYHPDSPDRGLAECNVAKQRNGSTGMVPLVFRNELSRFENASPEAIKRLRDKAFADRPMTRKGKPKNPFD